VATKEHLRQLADNLRASRDAVGISQVTLARRSGVDLSHLNKIENAHRDPTTGTLLQIARALGIPPAELLRDIR
jgi:transcriptional regulator with XRE-family HTH domain